MTTHAATQAKAKAEATSQSTFSKQLPICVVFLHGIGGQAKGFDDAIAWFELKGIKACAWNQPGYGGKPLVLPYTFSSIAAALMDDLTKLSDLPQQAIAYRYVFVGHSMGGMLAQTIALVNHMLAPQQQLQIAGLVLAQTSPAFGNSNGIFQTQFVNDRVAPLDAGLTMADVAKKLIPPMVGPSCEPAKVQFAASLMASVPPDTYRAALSALVKFDVRPQLDLINMPVLCLAAEYDKTAPPAVLEKLAAKLAQGSYECLPGLGHVAPMENNDLFCSAVHRFILTLA